MSFSLLTATAQTAADCISSTSLIITEGLRALQETPVYVNSAPLTLCINTEAGVNVTDLGVLSFSSTGSYPFTIEVTDRVTNNVVTLAAPGDQTLIYEGQLYFFELTPLAAGIGQVTLTPNAVLASLGVDPEVMDIEILAALPVTWSSPLSYTTVKNTHTFSWSVSQQENVAAYHLETSTANGFEIVATANPKRPNGEDIFYELKADARAQDAFYRVRQVDFDGNESTGNLVFVPGQFQGDVFRVYPNPAKEQVWVKGVGAGSTARLLSTTGQTVRSFTQVTDGGMLDVSGLKQGVYTLQVLENGRNSKSVRVVIW